MDFTNPQYIKGSKKSPNQSNQPTGVGKVTRNPLDIHRNPLGEFPQNFPESLRDRPQRQAPVGEVAIGQALGGLDVSLKGFLKLGLVTRFFWFLSLRLKDFPLVLYLCESLVRGSVIMVYYYHCY